MLHRPDTFDRKHSLVAHRHQNNLSIQSTLSDWIGSPGQKHPGRVESRVKGSDPVSSLTTSTTSLRSVAALTVAAEALAPALTTLAEALETVLEAPPSAEEAESRLTGRLERHALLSEHGAGHRAAASSSPSPDSSCGQQRLLATTLADARPGQRQRQSVGTGFVLVVRLGAAMPRCTKYINQRSAAVQPDPTDDIKLFSCQHSFRATNYNLN